MNEIENLNALDIKIRDQQRDLQRDQQRDIKAKHLDLESAY